MYSLFFSLCVYICVCMCPYINIYQQHFHLPQQFVPCCYSTTVSCQRITKFTYTLFKPHSLTRSSARAKRAVSLLLATIRS